MSRLVELLESIPSWRCGQSSGQREAQFGVRGLTLTPKPALFAILDDGSFAPTRYGPVNGQHDDGAHDRKDPSRGLTRPDQAHRLTNERSNERTDNAKQDRNDDAAGILARHHELRERSDDESDDN